MDTLQFSSDINPNTLAKVFQDFFEQHMVAYYIAKGVGTGRIHSVDMNKASIIYNIHILTDNDAEIIRNYLDNLNGRVTVFGHNIKYTYCINGDLLCITIQK